MLSIRVRAMGGVLMVSSMDVVSRLARPSTVGLSSPLTAKISAPIAAWPSSGDHVSMAVTLSVPAEPLDPYNGTACETKSRPLLSSCFRLR